MLQALLENPQLRAALQAGGLLLGRVLPLVVFTPMLGGQVLPARLRIGISLLLVLVLLPAVAPVAPVDLTSVQFAGLAFKEALVGLTLATMILLMYHAFTTFGAIVDVARGSTLANIYDPTTQQQQPVLGSLFLQAAIVLFLTLGGHRVVIEALGKSLDVIPLFDAAPPGMGGIPLFLAMLTELLVVAIRLAFPVILVILLLDVVLGLLNKVAPQVQVYFLGLTIKTSLGLAAVLLGLLMTIDLMRVHFVTVLERILSLGA